MSEDRRAARAACAMSRPVPLLREAGRLYSRISESAPVDPVDWFVAGWRRTGTGFLWWCPQRGFALAGARRTCCLRPRRFAAAVADFLSRHCVLEGDRRRWR